MVTINLGIVIETVHGLREQVFALRPLGSNGASQSSLTTGRGSRDGRVWHPVTSGQVSQRTDPPQTTDE